MIIMIVLTKIGLLLCYFNVKAQNNSLEIGGKLMNEWVEGKSYGPGIGLQAIYKITKHSGIETGLYYKTSPRFYFLVYTAGNYYKKVNEKTILIPLVYKFDSRLINFTAGMAVDYLIVKNQSDRDLSRSITKNNPGRAQFISTLSVSKNFYLNESLIFEPEIRGSSYIPAGGGGVGFNLSFRKKIF